jgi:uncharacterized protein YkwD
MLAGIAVSASAPTGSLSARVATTRGLAAPGAVATGIPTQAPRSPTPAASQSEAPVLSESTPVVAPTLAATPKPAAQPTRRSTPRPAPLPPKPPAPPPPPPPPAPQASGPAAAAVLQALNASRAQAGLPPLQMSAGLTRSAHLHNLAMAAADQLSHQLPGEPGLGSRISQQGVSWTWAGENCGESSSMSTAGGLGLEQAMMAEQPPNDGHRRNILSTSATMVGVDVVLDSSHHLLWLTEDFAN